MLVLSRRQNETLVFPGLETTIQVVSIKKGIVRLGIAAPEHIRVLRGEVPDRDTEWTDPPKETAHAAATQRQSTLHQLVEKRLAIVRRGLDEVQRSMAAATTEEAELLLDKLDEDLHLLRRRLHREATQLPRPRRRLEDCSCDTGSCQCHAHLPRSR
jgi:carbon storage regulator CsrA